MLIMHKQALLLNFWQKFPSMEQRQLKGLMAIGQHPI
ncbi:hypothetical protein OPIT5_29890 [Opitutaceae bacterium TAV5]|nr:hypothetical protein OPIT5_29890 [Opitutaceae bacterium TAV5]